MAPHLIVDEISSLFLSGKGSAVLACVVDRVPTQADRGDSDCESFKPQVLNVLESLVDILIVLSPAMH